MDCGLLIARDRSPAVIACRSGHPPRVDTRGVPNALPEPLDRIIPPLLDDLRTTLGDELAGVYQLGSAVSGGFDPGLSDLDLVIVTQRDVEAIAFERFAGVVERLVAREPDWAGRLDLAFVGRGALADLGSGGALLEISHEKPLHHENAAEWTETWFLARDADRPLVGPPAADVFPAISVDEFLRDVVAGFPNFVTAVRHDWPHGSVAYRVLTVCRVLRSLDSGALCTKLEGAAWAAERYPAWAGVIRAAEGVRTGGDDGRFADADRARVQPFLDFMAREIAASTSAGFGLQI
jgi:aminoglycoside adenylyltransferase-like protein/nucleotidyltransferase-like protein